MSSSLKTATLNDGSKIPVEKLDPIVASLKFILEFKNDSSALFNLYKKCVNPDFTYCCGLDNLRAVGLVDQTGNPASEEVIQVVKNYIWLKPTDCGVETVLFMPEGGYSASKLLDNGFQNTKNLEWIQWKSGEVKIFKNDPLRVYEKYKA